MANRHLARSIVIQTLFEWDFTQKSTADAESILSRNVIEFGPGLEEDDFAPTLLKGVIEKQKDLDEVIEKAAPDWPINKIATVDRNILRVGLYELLFSDSGEVPPKVAINEAIELAKSFGGETSGKFVNGVLGSVYREIGEPMKDQQSKKKDVPYEEMPVERLAGAVVYVKKDDGIFLAFVHDIFGHWTLSKGKMIEGESLEDGTVRKIKEEIGLDVTVGEQLGENEYIASDPEIGKIRKQVVYFLAEAKEYKDLVLPEDKAGLDDAQWFPLSGITELNFYNDVMPIVTKAVKILLEDDKDK